MVFAPQSSAAVLYQAPMAERPVALPSERQPRGRVMDRTELFRREAERFSALTQECVNPNIITKL
jgi:hypothetical protein